MQLDSGFRRNDEEEAPHPSFVMAGPLVPGLDPGINPAICTRRQITGSSLVMTTFLLSVILTQVRIQLRAYPHAAGFRLSPE
jgi:hypothetical protein